MSSRQMGTLELAHDSKVQRVATMTTQPIGCYSSHLSLTGVNHHLWDDGCPPDGPFSSRHPASSSSMMMEVSFRSRPSSFTTDDSACFRTKLFCGSPAPSCTPES